MPDIVMIMWVPLTIAFMAVTWVLTLGALGQQPVAVEDRLAAVVDD